MVKPIELALLGVGGTSLFTVCFLGFASITGVPMHSVPVIGSVFPAPPEPEEDPVVVVHDPTNPESVMPQRELTQEDRKALESSIASLNSWSLPPPYEIEEVARLIDELTAAKTEVERREAELDTKEADFAEDLLRLQQRGTQMEELRHSLEQREAAVDRKEAELQQLATELDRPDLVRSENAEKELLRKSLFFQTGDVESLAKRLVTFQPAEAAAILHKLEDESRAVDILNALPADSWQEYMEAFSKTSP
ncbi:MAG: hypothetical protein R3F34_05235 [Planctomycetota bacterium]